MRRKTKGEQKLASCQRKDAQTFNSMFKENKTPEWEHLNNKSQNKFQKLLSMQELYLTKTMFLIVIERTDVVAHIL